MPVLPGCCRPVRDYTCNPDEQLLKVVPEIQARVDALKKQLCSNTVPDGDKLLKSTGVWLQERTGNRDFSFFQPLPKPGTKVVP